MSARQQLRLYEGQLQVALCRRQRPALHIAAQAHACVQNCGHAINVDAAASTEAAVCVKFARARGDGVWQVPPMHQVI